MFRSVKLASFVSLMVCGIAFAEPQTLSYFLGACPASGSCQVATLPSKGFVLTDVIYPGTSTTLDLSVQEGSTTKARFVMGDVINGGSVRIQSYHLTSGIPFAGSSSLTTVQISNGNQSFVTLAGYIPGTQAQSVPAMGNLALSMMTLLVLGAGGYILHKRSLVRINLNAAT